MVDVSCGWHEPDGQVHSIQALLHGGVDPVHRCVFAFPGFGIEDWGASSETSRCGRLFL